jgi:hypothetical protein
VRAQVRHLDGAAVLQDEDQQEQQHDGKRRDGDPGPVGDQGLAAAWPSLPARAIPARM